MSLRPDLIPDLASQLKRLAELSADDDNATDQLPTTTLILDNGMAVSGRIFASAAERVLVGQDTGTTLTTILTSTIVAISVDNGPDTSSLFGLTNQRDGAVPTRLDLKRRLKSVADKLTSRVGHELTIDMPWDDLPDGDVARSDLGGLIDDFEAAVETISSDGLGLEALGSISAVTFQKADTVGVAVSSGTVEVSLNPRSDRILGPTEFLAALESAL